MGLADIRIVTSTAVPYGTALLVSGAHVVVVGASDTPIHDALAAEYERRAS